MKYKGYTFHDAIEVLGNHCVNLSLSIPAVIHDGSTDLNLSVTIEVLLVQRGGKYSKEGNSKARVAGSARQWDRGHPMSESGNDVGFPSETLTTILRTEL